MNPGLVIKLRPTGPWRIGPDSGARNRVDAIYHSDSLYSAVTSVIARLGSLEDWLDATARQASPAVCFSSCFPFLDEIGFVVPPRTVWPPTSPGLMSARVRWKSARFVPLGIVQAILAGQRLDPNHWSVDGASECLVPSGRPGPFRTGIRWNAAVDRLTGATERHSTACVEFRQGAGLWTIVSFADDAARDRWMEPVKAAFRLLADSGFGGERSRGWGRSEAPEFIEGTLPDMIVPQGGAPVSTEPPETPEASEVVQPAEPSAPAETPLSAEPIESAESAEPIEAAEPVEATAEVKAPSDTAPLAAPPAELPPDPEPEPPAEFPTLSSPPEPKHGEPVPPTPAPEVAPSTGAPEVAAAEAEQPAAEPTASTGTPSEPEASIAELTASTGAPEVAASESVQPDVEPTRSTVAPEVAASEPEQPAAKPQTASTEPPVAEAQTGEPPELPAAASEPPPSPIAAEAEPIPAPPGPTSAFWVLSLYTPAADDAVDWQRGNYTVVERGGRVDSSGDLKKELQMVAEGSVLAAVSEPRGAATDVAPDGFAHPVFRAGFAVCIPLPEVR